jgi:TonB family protein
MVESTALARPRISGELAASLRGYDPLAPERDRWRGRLIGLASVVVHALLLALLWNTLLGSVVEIEEVVVVRMIEPQVRTPDPPAAAPSQRPKVLAQRRLDTAVQRFKEIAQPEVTRVSPTPVLDRMQPLDEMQRVQVAPTKLTEAPKTIEQRTLTAERVSRFADVPTPVQPTAIASTEAAVRDVQAARPSAGPQVMQAAGPRPTAGAIEIAGPSVTEGEVSDISVEGSIDGARIAALSTGSSDRLLEGGGGSGLGGEGVGRTGGGEPDCQSDPVCQGYLKMIRDRVYARWVVPRSLQGGHVTLRFRIDRGGSAHGISVAATTSDPLGASCLDAFRHASPFPPPPPEIAYLVNLPIRARFSTSSVDLGSSER